MSLILLDSALYKVAFASVDTLRDNWEGEDASTTNLYQHIDDVAASDSDYIRTQLSPTNDVYVTKLTALVDPQLSTGHLLTYRYAKEAASGDQVDLTVQLRSFYVNESTLGTQIAEWVHTDIPSGWTQVQQILSGAEADAISTAAYVDELYVRIIGNTP